MSDETTLIEGAGEALPAASEAAPDKAPKSDAEAALQAPPEAAKDAEAPKDEAKDEETRKKNRTKEYISRINRENAELRQRMAEFEARKAPVATVTTDGAPTLDQYDYDIEKYQRALIEHTLKTRDEEAKQAESAKRQAETVATYNDKVAAFADEHPDFQEVVGLIAHPLSAEVQAAIMAHPKGPEIAYHLGNNDDDAFQLAAIQPHLADAAVKRLASRMTAAPQAPHTPTPKPVTQAPAPPPIVGGRAPTETPPEKLTDEEWYRREAKRRASQ